MKTIRIIFSFSILVLSSFVLHPASAEPSVHLAGASQARALVGHKIRFTGRAQNAKLSGLLERDGFSLYCLDQIWPEATLGKSIQVEGKLEYTDEFQARQSPDGEISQGTEGGDYVIRQCRLL